MSVHSLIHAWTGVRDDEQAGGDELAGVLELVLILARFLVLRFP
jgi:hypothetical protein